MVDFMAKELAVGDYVAFQLAFGMKLGKIIRFTYKQVVIEYQTTTRRTIKITRHYGKDLLKIEDDKYLTKMLLSMTPTKISKKG
jgi:hypothetical protein